MPETHERLPWGTIDVPPVAPPSWAITRCDHRGVASIYGIWWIGQHETGLTVGPHRYRDSTAWHAQRESRARGWPMPVIPDALLARYQASLHTDD